jgi:hypothetical protein
MLSQNLNKGLPLHAAICNQDIKSTPRLLNEGIDMNT